MWLILVLENIRIKVCDGKHLLFQFYVSFASLKCETISAYNNAIICNNQVTNTINTLGIVSTNLVDI